MDFYKLQKNIEVLEEITKRKKNIYCNCNIKIVYFNFCKLKIRKGFNWARTTSANVLNQNETNAVFHQLFVDHHDLLETNASVGEESECLIFELSQKL